MLNIKQKKLNKKLILKIFISYSTNFIYKIIIINKKIIKTIKYNTYFNIKQTIKIKTNKIFIIFKNLYFIFGTF